VKKCVKKFKDFRRRMMIYQWHWMLKRNIKVHFKTKIIKKYNSWN